jgi:hypothetical protein
MFHEKSFLAPYPTTDLEDQVLVFMITGDKVVQVYPSALGSSALQEHHFSYNNFEPLKGKIYDHVWRI